MASGIVAFAFGTPSDIPSNRTIARMTEKHALGLSAPIYTQEDIQFREPVSVTYTEEDAGEPPPTLRIARGAVRWAGHLGLKNLIIVCAQPHLWRCERDLRFAVAEADADIAVMVSRQIGAVPSEAWYCPESTQPRTQTKWSWRSRERILEWMPMFLYTRIAR